MNGWIPWRSTYLRIFEKIAWNKSKSFYHPNLLLGVGLPGSTTISRSGLHNLSCLGHRCHCQVTPNLIWGNSCLSCKAHLKGQYREYLVLIIDGQVLAPSGLCRLQGGMGNLGTDYSGCNGSLSWLHTLLGVSWPITTLPELSEKAEFYK